MTEPILETQGLTKEFRGFTAVRDVNLVVRRGTIHALIGPNGAGKTTVFNLLTKFLEPTAGRIVYKGRDITRERAADVARLGMVRSFQISAVFPHLTVRENVRIALQRPLGTSFHFWKSERSPRKPARAGGSSSSPRSASPSSPRSRRSRCRMAASALSRSRRPWRSIPRCCCSTSRWPGSGHEDIARISQLIRQVAANRTVLMVEHNLSVVADLSDTITVLTRGQILTQGSYAEVSKNPEVVEAYMGTGHA